MPEIKGAALKDKVKNSVMHVIYMYSILQKLTVYQIERWTEHFRLDIMILWSEFERKRKGCFQLQKKSEVEF